MGDGPPRRGNAFGRWVGRTLLGLGGWSIEGAVPDIRKCVTIAVPHTSNWDFYWSICAVFALGLRFDWIGKHTLFRKPFGSFMRWLGGTPVRRDATRGRVEQVVDIIERNDRYFLGIAPEGTRGATGHWKTGFYHVALGAAVPILLGYIDYDRKVVGLGPTFDPTGDLDADLAAIGAFYADKTPRHPENFSPPSPR